MNIRVTAPLTTLHFKFIPKLSRLSECHVRKISAMPQSHTVILPFKVPWDASVFIATLCQMVTHKYRCTRTSLVPYCNSVIVYTDGQKDNLIKVCSK